MTAGTGTAGRPGGSYRSLPVTWLVRWRLRWLARSDRRAGLPRGLSADTTPVLHSLLAGRDEACEAERSRRDADIAAIDARLAEIDARLGELQRAVVRRTDEALRAALPPTEEELGRRRPGERHLPAVLVRARRAREHRRAAAAAQAERRSARRALDAALAEEAWLEDRRRERSHAYRSRVLRTVEYVDRLATVYRRALIRRHPQRDVLVTRWQGDLVVPPAWVLTDDLVGGRRPPGRCA
ncbi:hypothetical protein [Blastococcus xanthinilyticus]|uniref:Uncharacterized protein n=1 Tax=Blastococcus xanthinilyticus TaxID=1564164 RepID=A0A5S5D6U0_9ACTN|nr:hypothetical protein [Blastococcus xanthinilyticus]TYP90766.1 hypothetical protein BD833_101485 [Blastococcus xanthinilyticus]